MSHTPGPWSYDADAEEVFGTNERYAIAWIPRFVRDDSDGRPLHAAERLANAHLIAASPDLLAAAKLALESGDQQYVQFILRDAIAKAEGRV